MYLFKDLRYMSFVSLWTGPWVYPHEPALLVDGIDTAAHTRT